MTPQKIATKLNKIEKVELASMRKVEQIYKEIDKFVSSAERFSSDVKNAAVQGLKTSSAGLLKVKEIRREIESVKKAADELGVKTDVDRYQAGVDSMAKALETLEEAYGVVKRFSPFG